MSYFLILIQSPLHLLCIFSKIFLKNPKIQIPNIYTLPQPQHQIGICRILLPLWGICLLRLLCSAFFRKYFFLKIQKSRKSKIGTTPGVIPNRHIQHLRKKRKKKISKLLRIGKPPGVIPTMNMRYSPCFPKVQLIGEFVAFG